MAVIDPPSYTLFNSSQGVDNAIISTTAQVGSFIPMFLLFVWMVIFMGGIRAQTRRTGTAEAPLWAAFASMGIFMITLLLTLAIEANVLLQTTLGITIGLTVITGLWAFFSSKE